MYSLARILDVEDFLLHDFEGNWSMQHIDKAFQ
jgi:hypothetical protein